MPSTIPAGGTKITIQVSAEVRSSNHAPFMGVYGDLVDNASRRVEVGTPVADNDPSTSNKSSETATAEVPLKPIAGTVKVDVGVLDGPKWTCTYNPDPEPTPSPSPTPTAAPTPVGTPPPRLTATVASVSGDVTVRVNGGPARRLRRGEPLPLTAEIMTGIDSYLTLSFSDGALMKVDEMTEIAMTDASTAQGRSALTVDLALGKISREVNPKHAFQTDFKLNTRDLSGAPRGTVFSVFYDAVAKVTVFTTQEGTVEVDPVGAGLATTCVTAGTEVAVGLRCARCRSAAPRRCRLTISRSPSALGAKPIAKGRLVSVRVGGRAKGKAIWRLRGRRASP